MADRVETDFGPGATGASSPRVPGIPTFSANATGMITINAPASNGNDAVVTYAIRCKIDAANDGAYETTQYVQADGSLGGSEAFQTLSAWGATITVTGLTAGQSHTFAASAMNELSVQSAYSAESAIMNSLPAIDQGPPSADLDRTITGGATIVDEDYGLVISGSEVPDAEETQSTLPEYYGDITVTYKLKNWDSTASRIVVEFSEDGTSWATATKGTGGDNITGLTTSPAGVSHTFVWDSYTDAGRSEFDTAVYLRITPYDLSPTGGDAAETVTSAAFAVNNLPAAITWANSDAVAWGEDTTPTFIATITSLRGGTGSYGFPDLRIHEAVGDALVRKCASYEAVAGWEYETEPDAWVALTPTGIPITVIDGVNRMRYTPTTALAAGDYVIRGYMWESRHEG
jgi:hypothetical protein